MNIKYPNEKKVYCGFVFDDENKSISNDNIFKELMKKAESGVKCIKTNYKISNMHKQSVQIIACLASSCEDRERRCSLNIKKILFYINSYLLNSSRYSTRYSRNIELNFDIKVHQYEDRELHLQDELIDSFSIAMPSDLMLEDKRRTSLFIASERELRIPENLANGKFHIYIYISENGNNSNQKRCLYNDCPLYTNPSINDCLSNRCPSIKFIDIYNQAL